VIEKVLPLNYILMAKKISNKEGTMIQKIRN